MIRDEFKVHMLNEEGKKKAEEIAVSFSNCLREIESMCGKEGREIAIVRTKLEEACFFAKRAMASKKENQQ